MVLCGMVWYGYAVVWYSVDKCSVVWYGMVWYWYAVVWYSVDKCSVVCYGMVLVCCGVVRCGKVWWVSFGMV